MFLAPLTMDRRRLSREPSLQKRAAENRRKAEPAVPDITDLMDAMFFGAVHNDNKQAYNVEDEEDGFDDSTTSNSSRVTQEWLEEARRLVASSPSRPDQPSPARFGTVSPRFVGQPGRLSASGLDRRDPLSRSARRHRSVETFSGEILSKTVKHSRNRSETALPDTPPDSPTPASPASAVHQWLSNILKPHHNNSNNSPTPTPPSTEPTSPSSSGLPPRQPPFRRSRFTKVTEPSPASEGIPLRNSVRRRFQTSTKTETVLSPPKSLLELARTRSVSSSTCSLPEKEKPLSPPKNLVQSAHRRSLSKSTCSLDQNINGGFSTEEELELGLNGFLKEQRLRIKMFTHGEIESKARIVLPGPSNSTSSMAAAICYAWLMEKKARKSNEDEFIFVPVMSFNRGRMWKQRQAAWLFHHVALDTSSLIFADEVDLESLMMCGQVSLLVVGEDILQISGQVGSSCSMLTDNFCEDAYDLLQLPVVKDLLLAGILLDTQNLRASSNQSMGRDVEAVQLLLVGSPPNSRAALFDQLMQDQRDQSFFEVLQHDYGNPPGEIVGNFDNKGHLVERKNADQRGSVSGPVTQKLDKNSLNSKAAKSSKGTPTSGKHDEQAKQTSAAAPDNNRGKNKFFLAKWFGFGQN